MKRFLAVSFIILAVTIAVFAQEHTRPSPTPIPPPRSTPTIPNPEGWVTFNSEAGRFTVLMPDIPPEKTDTVQSEHGPYTTHLFVTRGTSSTFLIGWVDYDPTFNFNRTAEIKANMENFIKGVSATLVSSRNLVIDGYDSLEFTAESPDRLFKSRVYMVGRRPYQLVSVTAKGVDDSANIARFFDSFKVRQ
jgi:hypothetical protein